MDNSLNLSRREFSFGGAKVGLAFLAGRALAPLLGQPAGPARPAGRRPGWIDLTSIPSIDDSLALLAAYLLEYRPPSGQFTATAWKAVYDVIEWRGTTRVPGSHFSRGNRAAGYLAVTRQLHGDSLTYSVDQDITIAGFGSRLESTMTCAAAPFPALREWETAYAKRPLSHLGTRMTLKEKGRAREGALDITTGSATRQIPTTRPVAPQWAVHDGLGALARDRAAQTEPTDVEFDLFHDLTSFRPHQRLMHSGTLDITLGGTTHQLHGFLQLGLGTEPTHHWVDGQGRCLLTTGGLLASALTALETV